jgi:glycosyltransferase involved in cell wall biosynthesis
MRVGLVIYGSLDTLSGGYLYDRKLVEFLRGCGDEVEIVSLPWRDYARHLGDNFSFQLARKLDNLDVDILLEDELNHPSLALHNARLLWRGRFPVLSIAHHLRSSEMHPGAQKLLYGLVERQYLRSVEGFIYNSQTTRQAVELLRGFPAQGVVATPAGDRFGEMSKAEIAARSQAGGRLLLLFAGNLIARKGLHTLLAALLSIPSTDWELRIVGRDDVDPIYTARLRQLARPFNGRVKFMGRLSDDAMADELRIDNIMVVPSSYEGFGIVYLDGMAFGLPCIGTSAGGAAEIIADGTSGLIVPPQDSHELARAIQRMIGDRERLRVMSLAARERYKTFPTWEETTEKIRTYLLTWIK